MNFFHHYWRESSTKNSSSFTLIELLIVVAIIGILAALIIVSLNIVLPKARDARRKADLSEIQKALAEYYINNGAYPPSASTTGGWCTNISNQTFASGNNSVKAALLQYMSSVPQDPLYANTNKDYFYSLGYGCGTTQCYGLAAVMENAQNANGSISSGGCVMNPNNQPNNTTFNYIVSDNK